VHTQQIAEPEPALERLAARFTTLAERSGLAVEPGRMVPAALRRSSMCR
jgi:trehalose 6-phosphate phosphatase